MGRGRNFVPLEEQHDGTSPPAPLITKSHSKDGRQAESVGTGHTQRLPLRGQGIWVISGVPGWGTPLQRGPALRRPEPGPPLPHAPQLPPGPPNAFLESGEAVWML